jgi:hypothetical protein
LLLVWLSSQMSSCLIRDKSLKLVLNIAKPHLQIGWAGRNRFREGRPRMSVSDIAAVWCCLAGLQISPVCFNHRPSSESCGLIWFGSVRDCGPRARRESRVGAETLTFSENGSSSSSRSSLSPSPPETHTHTNQRPRGGASALRAPRPQRASQQQANQQRDNLFPSKPRAPSGRLL